MPAIDEKPRILLRPGDEIFHELCGKWHVAYRDSFGEYEERCHTAGMLWMKCDGKQFCAGHEGTPPAGRVRRRRPLVTC